MKGEVSCVQQLVTNWVPTPTGTSDALGRVSPGGRRAQQEYCFM